MYYVVNLNATQELRKPSSANASPPGTLAGPNSDRKRKGTVSTTQDAALARCGEYRPVSRVVELLLQLSHVLALVEVQRHPGRFHLTCRADENGWEGGFSVLAGVTPGTEAISQNGMYSNTVVRVAGIRWMRTLRPVSPLLAFAGEHDSIIFRCYCGATTLHPHPNNKIVCPIPRTWYLVHVNTILAASLVDNSGAIALALLPYVLPRKHYQMPRNNDEK